MIAKMFQRQRDDASSALDTGVLPIGRLEIARLDNDPSFPERGVLDAHRGRRQVSAATSGCGCCSGVDAAHAARGREPARAVGDRVPRRRALRLLRVDDRRRSPTPTGRGSPTLGTRDHDDFSIALLDAWAVAADVLAFYNERLANESYLRTARERISLQELGRLIGYRLRPGVAAETTLAFALEPPPDVPAAATQGSGLGAAGDAAS